MGLTFTILALIFMQNNKVCPGTTPPTHSPLIPIPQISDDNLFKFLRQLGVAEEDR